MSMNLKTWKLASLIAALALILACGSLPDQVFAQSDSKDAWKAKCREMVNLYVKGAGVTNERVLIAMKGTPRHEFMPSNVQHQAYQDAGVAIGEAQTISSPFIVAYMTEAIDPRPEDKVLEIGTGSGYQAAILSPLVEKVYSIEIVEKLGKRAARTLKRLGYDNVETKVGDGFLGWPEHAPFNKIIVTCSPEKIPRPLIEQLAEGGIIIVPVGERYQQSLFLAKKINGKMVGESLRPTLFVPMTGDAEELRQVKPDPLNPKLLNPDFEQEPGEDGFIKGWYYQRLLSWEEDKLAPGGTHFVTFENEDAGRAAHIMQGFPIDGTKIASLKVTGSVRYENVIAGPDRRDLPVIAVTFYDEQRRDLGSALAGPFTGTDETWRRKDLETRVPSKAKEAIIRIGLFGATGKVSFDNLKMTVVKK